MASHREVTENFGNQTINKSNGAVEWKGSNVSCHDNHIDSYGWWPMAYYLGYRGSTHLFIKQGDRYSNSTGKHQGHVQSSCPGPTVSFSAMTLANIPVHALTLENLIDYQEDSRIWLRRKDKDSPWHYGDGDVFRQPKQGMLIIGNWDADTAHWHTLGACLLEWGNKRYLCSLDDNSYFISELSIPVNTCEEAFNSLKPLAVIEAERGGTTVQRQGEWFFIDRGITSPVLAKTMNATQKDMRSYCNTELPKRQGSNSHACRNLRLLRGEILVTGAVKHNDHRMVKLGDTWWSAHKNTEIQSWSASGGAVGFD